MLIGQGQDTTDLVKQSLENDSFSTKRNDPDGKIFFLDAINLHMLAELGKISTSERK